MMTIISGVGLLLLTLAVFSIFSLKFPKGSQAMSGMANAAVASFLIEAVHKYITGDLLGIAFLGEVGATAGSLGGVAAGIMVPLSMGVNPVFAVVGGLACGGYGILPGFIAGYIVGLIAPYIEKYLPTGLDIILGSLTIAPMARLFALVVDPAVNSILGMIGGTITAAADQSPVIMGFLLGGIMKMIPGLNQFASQMDDEKTTRQMNRSKAIIRSMTKEERQDPGILRASRKKRIAAGSGTTVQEVNALDNQFEKTRQMMKQMAQLQKGGKMNMNALMGQKKGMNIPLNPRRRKW